MFSKHYRSVTIMTCLLAKQENTLCLRSSWSKLKLAWQSCFTLKPEYLRLLIFIVHCSLVHCLTSCIQVISHTITFNISITVPSKRLVIGCQSCSRYVASSWATHDYGGSSRFFFLAFDGLFTIRYPTLRTILNKVSYTNQPSSSWSICPHMQVYIYIRKYWN